MPHNLTFHQGLPRLAIDRSICILTRPVVITGFNRSLLVDWWLIGPLKLEDLKVLRRSPDLLNNVKIGQGQLQLKMEQILFFTIYILVK